MIPLYLISPKSQINDVRIECKTDNNKFQE